MKVRNASQICGTYVVEDGRPAFHRDALEDGEHRVDDVVEADDAVLRSLPVGLARRPVAARVAAAPARRVRRTRMLVLVLTEVQFLCTSTR